MVPICRRTYARRSPSVLRSSTDRSRSRCDAQSLGRDVILEEIDLFPLDTTDQRLVRMLLDTQVIQNLVDHPGTDYQR